MAAEEPGRDQGAGRERDAAVYCEPRYGGEIPPIVAAATVAVAVDAGPNRRGVGRVLSPSAWTHEDAARGSDWRWQHADHAGDSDGDEGDRGEDVRHLADEVGRDGPVLGVGNDAAMCDGPCVRAELVDETMGVRKRPADVHLFDGGDERALGSAAYHGSAEDDDRGAERVAGKLGTRPLHGDGHGGPAPRLDRPSMSTAFRGAYGELLLR